MNIVRHEPPCESLAEHVRRRTREQTPFDVLRSDWPDTILREYEAERNVLVARTRRAMAQR